MSAAWTFFSEEDDTDSMRYEAGKKVAERGQNYFIPELKVDGVLANVRSIPHWAEPAELLSTWHPDQYKSCSV